MCKVYLKLIYHKAGHYSQDLGDRGRQISDFKTCLFCISIPGHPGVGSETLS